MAVATGLGGLGALYGVNVLTSNILRPRQIERSCELLTILPSPNTADLSLLENLILVFECTHFGFDRKRFFRRSLYPTDYLSVYIKRS